MVNPVSGKRVRGAQSGRPLAALLDLLGRRWTLRALWELRKGVIGFRNLQLDCGGVSPTVLSKRLFELRAAGLVDSTPLGLVLTASGESLLQLLSPLGDFAQGWAKAGPRARGASRQHP